MAVLSKSEAAEMAIKRQANYLKLRMLAYFRKLLKGLLAGPKAPDSKKLDDWYLFYS